MTANGGAAGGRCYKTAQDRNKRGFTRTIGPEKGKDFALLNIERYGVERGVAALIGLGKLVILRFLRNPNLMS